MPFSTSASRLFVCLLFVAVLSAPSFAANRDRTQFGRNISIAAGEEAGEITCFGCSVRIRGHVTGDVTTFGGTVLLEDQGEISGDTTVFGADLRLDKGARADGDVAIFGGRLHRDPNAIVGGDIANFGGSIWLFLIFGLPILLLAGFIALIVWIVRLLTRRAVPAAA